MGWGSGLDHSVYHLSLGTTVWLHLGLRKGARLSCRGEAAPALMLISVYQTGSPRSSSWPQSWSSTWAQSPSSAAWPLATHCPPGTAWSCARLTALCSRYCSVPLPHHLHVHSSLKSTCSFWAASDSWGLSQGQSGGADGTFCATGHQNHH